MLTLPAKLSADATETLAVAELPEVKARLPEGRLTRKPGVPTVMEGPLALFVVKLLSPRYEAVMDAVPVGRLLMVRLAWPVASSAAAPIELEPEEKLTTPVGVPEVEEMTTSVIVSGAPGATWLALAESVCDTLAWLTVNIVCAVAFA